VGGGRPETKKKTKTAPKTGPPAKPRPTGGVSKKRGVRSGEENGHAAPTLGKGGKRMGLFCFIWYGKKEKNKVGGGGGGTIHTRLEIIYWKRERAGDGVFPILRPVG